jgi:tRNA pseudouridine55 synthase
MLIFVDKPSGFTSGDIVRKVKKLYPKAKVGHSGTLDPMASGLLILGVGKDTKKLTQIQKLPKEYITTIDFSLETDTWDKDYYEKFNQYQVVEKD